MRNARRRRSPVFLILIIIVGLIIAFIAISQTIQFILNLWEFGDLFVRPFYYSLIGGLTLSVIALFRFDCKSKIFNFLASRTPA